MTKLVLTAVCVVLLGASTAAFAAETGPMSHDAMTAHDSMTSHHAMKRHDSMSKHAMKKDSMSKEAK